MPKPPLFNFDLDEANQDVDGAPMLMHWRRTCVVRGRRSLIRLRRRRAREPC
ncbi:hypothetical protein V6Z12_D11G118200 [Gossypium hirsutum]